MTKPDDRVKMYLAQDYHIVEETEDYYLLRKNQSAVVHILLALFFWYLLFIPNFVYALVKVSNRKKIIK